MERPHHPLALPAGLATLYVVWGSTYLAVALAIRTLPPFLMMSARHVIAGALLLAWAYRRGRASAGPVTRRTWGAAFVLGACLFLLGHGGVAWAQQTVPTGVTALIVGAIPLWLAVMDRVFFGQRLTRIGLAGLVLGFGGLAVLVGPPGDGRVDGAGAGVLVVGTIAWAAGTLYSRGASLPANPVLAAGMGAFAGGILLAVLGAATGELGELDPSAVSAESLGGLAYLIVAGSLIAFTVYVWLLRTTRTSLVATYAYVNPIVAILLGWALLDETIGLRTLGAATLIVVAVALIVGAGRNEEPASRHGTLLRRATPPAPAREYNAEP